MTSRERIKTIFSGKPADRCGFWLGHPHRDTWAMYLKHFGLADGEQLRQFLHDDIRTASAESAYKHPEGIGMFSATRKDENGRDVPVFAGCETVAEVEAFDWPNPDYLDFTDLVQTLRGMGDHYRASGMWGPYFHTVGWMMGQEEYFIKMHTHPEVVEAVTRHVCDFLYEANDRFFKAAGDEVDAFFFGNDYGTQLDLFISPEMFDKFILPDTQRLVDLAHKHNRQVWMHCCGAVSKLIDRFIDAGINSLHPLQALARGMDAESLATRFKGRIAFVGGIDTQQLLIHGTPDEIRAEVRRVRDLLGPCYVVSPSHEAILPNVPPENVLAMAEEARGE